MSRVVVNSLPFATRLRSTISAKKLLEHDRKRARKFLAGLSHHRPINVVKKQDVACNDSIDVTDAGVTYTALVGVGSPATQYNLLIDTGSSNTWLGADKPYEPSGTSQDTGNAINVTYGSGGMSGEEYTDQVTLGPGLVIEDQSIGVANSTQGFSGVDGILGVGPPDLTQGTVLNTGEVPTVTDNLYAQGIIPAYELGIYYEPSSTTSVANGELTFGGVDQSKITSNVNYVPITSTAPASKYWGIDQSLTYGDSDTTVTLLNTTAGIVDTGTTLLLLASDAFQAYQEATGATIDQNTGLLTISEDQYDKLKPMVFHIGNITYKLTPNAQIWPRKLNSVIGGETNQIYLITGDLGTPSGSGLNFINGFGWLQRFYSVFDTKNSRIGFATTCHTDDESN